MDSIISPKVKGVFPVFTLGETIYVAGPGELFEIEDPLGKIRRLMSLLDGTRAFDDVSAALPDVPVEDLRTALETLDRAKLVENGAATTNLDAHARERWSRNIGFFEAYSDLAVSKYELQRRLTSCRVVLLGLGGVGSHLLYDLAALGLQEVRVVDFDRVELSNLNRQILYSEAEIGRLKTDAAVERIRAFNSRIRLDPVTRQLTSAEDVFEVVDGFDVVIAAVDRPKMRIADWVNEGCVRAGVALITGGVDVTRSFYYTILPGISGCVRCWRTQASLQDPVAAAISTEMERQETRQQPGERFGQDLAAFCPLVTLQTACLIAELVRLATGIAPPLAAGRLIATGFDDFVAREAEHWERLPDCPVCGGEREGRTGAAALESVS
jgi:molybdopterin/thiamine biosynthesis adenylyltransferase